MLSKGMPINFEDPAEDDVFGLGTRADISWKGLLDMTTCTESWPLPISMPCLAHR
jgi:hypothetical protein